MDTNGYSKKGLLLYIFNESLRVGWCKEHFVKF